MTQVAPFSLRDVLNDSNNVLAMLERYRMDLPNWTDAEIVRHQTLHNDLRLHQDLNELTLDEWRQALARRWECEVVGQRFYLEIQQQIQDFYGAESPHLKVFALSSTEAHARSAAELLADLRRVEAALKLIRPSPFFVAKKLDQLMSVCANLDSAIQQSHHCEAQRRNAVLGQRVVHTAYQRARMQTERLVAQHVGRGALLEMSGIGAAASDELADGYICH